MIYEKFGFQDATRQVYVVGARVYPDSPMDIIAMFYDIDAPRYDASIEADKLLSLLEGAVAGRAA